MGREAQLCVAMFASRLRYLALGEGAAVARRAAAAAAPRTPFAARAPLLRRSLCSAADSVPMTFIDEEGEEVQVEAEVGKSLLEVAHANEIDLEGARQLTRRHMIFYARLSSPPPLRSHLPAAQVLATARSRARRAT